MDIAELEEILKVAQKVLLNLEKRKAGFTSLSIPSDLIIELEDKRREVDDLENKIEIARSAKQIIQPSTQIDVYSPSLMRSRVSDKHYIERDEAKKLLECFALAIKEQNEQPLIFNIYGIGGVGKSTLLGRLKDAHVDNVDFLEICFAKTNDVENPLTLMKKLHQQSINLFNCTSNSDAFTEKYQQFEATLFELSQKSINGEQNSTEDKIKITSWFERFVWLGAIGLKPATSKQISLGVSGAGSSTLTAMGEDTEGLQEWIHQRVRNHPVTKDRPDLQSLMLEPVSKLTQAFVNSLIQTTQSRDKALVLVLDTYEKAQSYLNQWLWQFLVEDTPLSSARVLLVVLGRRPLKADENWRKLHQDRKLLYEVQLVKFNKKDTDEYLEKIGIDNGGLQAKIFKATKGLPYYLNWVREQKEKGIDPDFSKGNQEIVELLLQGLDSTKRKIIRIISCCRWFDLSIIRYLLKSDDLGLGQTASEAEEHFEWLKNSDYVILEKENYCLDDVARDAFRQVYFKDDRNQFHKTNALLAQYFKQESDEIIDPQNLLPDCYEDTDWRRSTIEFLYYSLFGSAREGLKQYVEHVFTGIYLHYPDVFMTPFSFIDAEMSAENNFLLPSSTNEFFRDSATALILSPNFLGVYPIIYEFSCEGKLLFSDQNELLSNQIEVSIQSLLKSVLSLNDGFGKCVGLLYKSLRCNNPTERIDLLQKSQDLSDDIFICCHPRLARNVYINLCNSLVAMGCYEDSLNCYQKAIEIDSSDVSTFIGQGLAFFNLKRYEDALESFGKAIDLDDKYVNAWTNRSAALINLQRYEEALESSENAINLDNTFVRDWVNKGAALIGLKRHQEALESSENAINLDNTFVKAWANKGAALIGLKRHQEALESSENAISIDKTFVNAWLIKGTALIYLEQYDNALESLQKAIELDDKSINAWINRGAALINLQRYEEALKSSQKATKLDNKSVHAWNRQGSVLLHLERYEEAVNSYQNAIDLDSKFIDAWIGLCVALFALERYKEVLDSSKKAISLDSESIDAWLNQGAALINLGRHEESLESLIQAIKLDSESIDAWLNQGAVLINLSRYEEALDSYQKAINIDNKSIEAWVNQGVVLNILKRYEESLKKFQQALKLKPTSIEALMNKGFCLGSLHRYEEAAESYQQVLKINRKVINAWNRQGSVLIELERYEQSIESYQQATILDPKCVDAWVGLGDALCSAERYEEALEKSAIAIKLDPKSAYAWNRRGIIFLLLRRYDEALDALNSSEAISNDCYLLNTKALVLSLNKKVEEAITFIDKSIILEPENVLLKANRGIILARAGRHDEALIECEQAIEQDPNHEIGYYGKACCYAQQGEVDLAIENLLKAIDIKPRLSRTEAKHNPDFDSIRDTRQFQKLIYQGS